MENQEKQRQTDGVKSSQCRCFNSSSRFGKMMMKMMKKMCGSHNDDVNSARYPAYHRPDLGFSSR